jgi:hypothetical protein
MRDDPPLTHADLDLLNRLIERAREKSDGHLTIMRFTTNWRVGFFTPDGREELDGMAGSPTFAQAARLALAGVRSRYIGPAKKAAG